MSGGRKLDRTAALLLAMLCAPTACQPAPATDTSDITGVTGGGVTLTSTAVDLPADDAAFPAGPNADLVTTRCTACHSASMVLSQPDLSPDQWQAEVKKMREVYRAPVPDTDVPAILAYLNALTAARGQPATAKAQDPAPKAKPRIS